MHSADDHVALDDDSMGERPVSDEFVGRAMERRLAQNLFGEDVAPIAIGRFEVISTIGVGGMGIVVKAHDPKLKRDVAIKLLRLPRARDEALPRRLEQEAQALARFSHPNVVQVFEVGEHEGQVFLVMEYVDGGSLRDWLSETPRSWRAILDLYLQAGAGLVAAHRVGIIHRDFKPSNVIVDREGRARVADFGLARESSSDRLIRDGSSSNAAASGSALETLTRTGLVVGTPAYMSPEQIAGQDLDGRSDLFSFCVSLWEALAGNRPYRLEQLRRVLADPSGPAPAPRGAPEGPRWIRRALRRGLAVDPDRRWPSVEALLVALRSAPIRRRNIFASFGVIAASGVAWAAWDYAVPDRCPSAEFEMSGVWDPERRAEVQDLAAGSSREFVREMWPKAQAGLDAYAESWVAARNQMCEATRIRGRQSEEQFDLGVACLDARRLEFATTIDLLLSGRTDVLMRAVELVDGLEALDACTSTHHLRRPGQRASILLDDARAAEIARTVAGGRALLNAQLYIDALSSARAAVLAARRLGDPWRLAEALHLEGSAEQMLGDAEAAAASLHESVALALSAGDSELAARGWIRQAQVAVFEEQDATAATRALDLATAILGPDMAPQTAFEFGIASADLAAMRSDYELAMTRLAEARGALPIGDARLPQAIARTAGLLGELGRLDDSDRLYEEAIALHERRMGGSHPTQGKWRINLAINEMERTNPDLDRAWRLCNRGLTDHDKAYGTYERWMLAPLLTAADIAQRRGDRSAAGQMLQEAVDVAVRELPVGHTERSGAMAALANFRISVEDDSGALRLYRNLVTEYAAAGSARDLAAAHQNVAWALCKVEHCAGAHAELQAARVGLAPQDELQVYVDVQEAIIELEEGRFARAVEGLEASAPRLEKMDRELHPWLFPEYFGALSRALAKRGGSDARARRLAREASDGFRALGRIRDAEAFSPAY